jgi:hypothetical protein
MGVKGTRGCNLGPCPKAPTGTAWCPASTSTRSTASTRSWSPRHHRHRQPSALPASHQPSTGPRGRAQVYSVRIPADALSALRRLAEARGQLPSVLIRGWVLERLRQETTGEELLVSRDELARIVREQPFG